MERKLITILAADVVGYAAHMERDENPDYGIKDEAVFPSSKVPQYSGSLLKPYLADLAKAGLPE